MPGAEGAPAELLPWDSEFWGVTIGRVTDSTLTPDRMRAIDEWAAQNGVACLYFLTPAEDAASTRAAEDGGFRLVEIRVVLRRARLPFRFEEFPPPPAGITVREGRAEDVEDLRRIASASYFDSRFYVDPNFPDERAGELYAIWVERSLEGYQNDTVLVAESEGRVVGFTTIAPEHGRARISLIAVDPARIRGTMAPRVSHALADAIMHWAEERKLGIHAVTQGRNVRTQRFIQRYGPHVHGISLYFHKWYR